MSSASAFSTGLSYSLCVQGYVLETPYKAILSAIGGGAIGNARLDEEDFTDITRWLLILIPSAPLSSTLDS